MLNLKDITGLIASSNFSLSYLILIAKVYIWDCRRECVTPHIAGYKPKVKLKYQTEKYIATKNGTLTNWTKTLVT